VSEFLILFSGGQSIRKKKGGVKGGGTGKGEGSRGRRKKGKEEE